VPPAGQPCLWFSLENAARVIADELAVVQERAEAITMVVTTITQVAHTTHLLSLNVSVETARVGQQARALP
jgi:methyl-accepting chemotaxis protein WspA